MTYDYKKNEAGERQLDESGNFIVFDVKTKEERPSDLLVLLNDKIPTKNSEAEASRKENLTLTKSLKDLTEKYSGLGDPDEALKMINIAKSVSDKDLIDGAKAEQAKLDLLADSKSQMDGLHEEYGNKIKALTDENAVFKANEFENFKLSQLTDTEALKSTIYAKHIRGALNEFGANIKRDEDGKTVIVDWSGNVIRTTDPENMGQPAPVEEGLKKLVETHPNKGNIIFAGSGGRNETGTFVNSDNGFVSATRADMKDPRKYQELKKKAGGDINKIKIVD